ncbi:MAG: hypothetical protein HOE82_02505, partial [Gammaproteobacteria bacterium]|nr:hypothetical protein [Gammaproteobacteria bacterium]
MLSILEGEITESELATALEARIDLIDTSGTGLVDLSTGVRSDSDRHRDVLLETQEQEDELGEGLIRAALDASAAIDKARAAQEDLNSWRNAQIVIDPETGLIDLTAVDASIASINSTLNTVQVQLNATDATVSTKATQVEVDGLDTRITTAETDINAAEASITTKVAQTEHDAVDTRVTTAETTITQHTADIVLKATSAEIRGLALDSIDGQYWGFDSGVEGWTGDSATVAQSSGDLTVDVTGTSGGVIKTGLTLDLDSTPYMMIRIKQTAGSGWDGDVQIANDGHTAYSAATTYSVGNIVSQGGKVYKCKTAVSVAESFDSAKWTDRGSTASYATVATLTAPPSSNSFSENWAAEPELSRLIWVQCSSTTIASAVKIQLGASAADDFAIAFLGFVREPLTALMGQIDEARLGEVIAELDAEKGVIALKATSSYVDSTFKTITSAGTEYNTLDGKITQNLSDTYISINNLTDQNEQEAEGLLTNIVDDSYAQDTQRANTVRIASAEASVTANAAAASVEVASRQELTALMFGESNPKCYVDGVLDVTAHDADHCETMGGIWRGDAQTEGVIKEERDLRITAESAEVTARETLEAVVNDEVTGVAAAHAAITTEATTRASADSAEVTARETLAAAIPGDITAAINTNNTIKLGYCSD